MRRWIALGIFFISFNTVPSWASTLCRAQLAAEGNGPEAFRRPSGRGFALLDSRGFFPEQKVRELYKTVPPGSTVTLSGDHVTPGQILADPRHGAPGRLPFAQLQMLEEYLQWLTGQVRSLLPPGEEAVLAYSDLRVSNAVEESGHFPLWHQDGNYLAAAVALLGPSTEFRTDGPDSILGQNALAAALSLHTSIFAPDRGETVLFSCVERRRRYAGVVPTLHRSPEVTGPRVFLIARFNARRR